MSRERNLKRLIELETLLENCSSDDMREFLLKEKKRLENEKPLANSKKHGRRHARNGDTKEEFAKYEGQRINGAIPKAPGNHVPRKKDGSESRDRHLDSKHFTSRKISRTLPLPPTQPNPQEPKKIFQTKESLKQQQRGTDTHRRKESKTSKKTRAKSADIFCEENSTTKVAEGNHSQKKRHKTRRRGSDGEGVKKQQRPSLEEKTNTTKLEFSESEYKNHLAAIHTFTTAKRTAKKDTFAAKPRHKTDYLANGTNAVNEIHSSYVQNTDEHHDNAFTELTSDKELVETNQELVAFKSDISQHNKDEMRLFSKEEINQMSRSHHITNKLNHFEAQTYSNTKPISTSHYPKAATWKAIIPQHSYRNHQTGEDKEVKLVSKSIIPVVDEIKRESELNLSSSSSTISSRLMKLRQEESSSRATTKDHKDLKQQQTSEYSEKKQSKSTSVKTKSTKVHKLLRWQQSSPAVLEETEKSIKVLPMQHIDVLHYTTVKQDLNGKTHKSLTRTHHPESKEIVFHVDLDELNQKQQKQNRLSSFFRQKGTKTKNTRDTKKDMPAMINSWEIPNLLVSQATQVQQTLSTSVCIQTQIACKGASTQTSPKLTNGTSTQTQTSVRDVQTQTEPATVTAETQTEDEDSPVWGIKSRLSLDRLVRSRGKKHKKHKVTRMNSYDEVDTHTDGKESISNTVFRRSATLPHGHKDHKPAKQKMTSYNWTQTEKFIKIIVSYSGVHLIPTNCIKVSTNGINLRLQISQSQDASDQNKSSDSNISQQVVAELHIPMLCHLVSALSYTVQSDMVTVLLRKQRPEKWETLEFHSATVSTAQDI